MSKRKVLLFLLILLVAGGGTYLAIHLNMLQPVSDATDVVSLVPEDVNVDISLDGVEFSRGEAGELTWKVSAASGGFDRQSGQVTLVNPVLTYYYGAEREKMVVAAPKGEVVQERQWVRMWPAVEGTYQDNRVLANEMEYFGEAKEVHLQGDVQLYAPQGIIKAPRAVVSLTDNTVTATGGVDAVISSDAVGGPAAF